MEKRELSFWYFAAALSVMMAAQYYFNEQRHVETLSYSEFKTLLRAGKLDKLVVAEQQIGGVMKTDGLDGLLPAASWRTSKRRTDPNTPLRRCASPILT